MSYLITGCKQSCGGLMESKELCNSTENFTRCQKEAISTGLNVLTFLNKLSMLSIINSICLQR